MAFMNRIKDISLFFDGLSEELKAIKHWIKKYNRRKTSKNSSKDVRT